MSKLLVDNLEWAHQLECPPSACTDHVKRILNRGINNYVWDEISLRIHPADDVMETRKNILLHYLNNGKQLPSIVHIQNTKRLKKERVALVDQHVKLQEECDNVNKRLEEKGLKLAKIKDKQRSVRIKKDILELKYQETSKENNNCKKMLEVCQTLLPPTNCDIDPNIMNQCLTIAGAISCRQDKHEAWKIISKNLGSTTIEALWRWILNKRIKDTETLVNLCHHTEHTDESVDEFGQPFKIGTSKMRGKHMISFATKLIHLNKINDGRERAFNYLELILKSISCDITTDWLQLALEVTKLEKIHSSYQSEIQDIKTKLIQEDDNLQQRQLQLYHDIQDIDCQAILQEQLMPLIERAMLELDSAPQSILNLKNLLMRNLEIITLLHSQTNNEWQETCTQAEVQMFQDNLDINALDKVMLRGRIGAYRHSSTCMSNALISRPTVTSATPVYRAPLYHLMACYQDLTINTLLQQYKRDSVKLGQIKLAFKEPPSTRDNEIMELLEAIRSTSENCCQEIESFHSIADTWMRQPVQEIMQIIETSVHGAKYPEWIKRYTALVYMIQRQK